MPAVLAGDRVTVLCLHAGPMPEEQLLWMGVCALAGHRGRGAAVLQGADPLTAGGPGASCPSQGRAHAEQVAAGALRLARGPDIARWKGRDWGARCPPCSLNQPGSDCEASRGQCTCRLPARLCSASDRKASGGSASSRLSVCLSATLSRQQDLDDPMDPRPLPGRNCYTSITLRWPEIPSAEPQMLPLLKVP